MESTFESTTQRVFQTIKIPQGSFDQLQVTLGDQSDAQ